MDEIHVNQIQYTTDYSKFKNIVGQRDYSPSHLNTLVKDETFPKKFKTSPIIVGEDGNDLFIVDGNHRFLAAQKLNIPIFYIIDEEADVKDMAIRNSQQASWKGKDYLNYYGALGFDDYIYIKKLMSEFSVPVSHITIPIQSFIRCYTVQFARKFKKGEVKIGNHKENIYEFLSTYFPLYKDYTFRVGSINARALVTIYYIQALIDLFLTEKQTYYKFINKLKLNNIEIMPCNSKDLAKECIMKISRSIKNKCVPQYTMVIDE